MDYQKLRRSDVSAMLQDYLSQGHGFFHDGEWYLRGSWLDKKFKDFLEAEKIITHVGTPWDLKQAGVNVQEIRRSGLSRAIFYKLNREKVEMSA